MLSAMLQKPTKRQIYDSMTQIEKDIILRMINNETTADIARRWNVTPSCVYNWKARLRRKAGLTSNKNIPKYFREIYL